MTRGFRNSVPAFGRRLDIPGGQRKASRSPVRLSASLQALNCSRPVTLLDVSREGAKLCMPEPMYRGQEVWLKVGDAQVFGIVRWVSDPNCGIVFDEPLNDRLLAMLQAKGKTVMVQGLRRDEQLGREDYEAILAPTLRR